MATNANKEKIDLKKLAEAVAKLAETLPERVTEGRTTIKSTLQAQALHIRVLIKKKYRAIDIVQLLKGQGFNITPKTVREVFAQVEKENTAATQGKQTAQTRIKNRTDRKPKEAQRETSSGDNTSTQKPAAEVKKDSAKEQKTEESSFNLEDSSAF